MFYLYRDGATLGPFSDQELREAFQRGELAGAVVCLVGAQSWVSPEVAFGAQASSEPAPPAPQAPPVREAQPAAVSPSAPPDALYPSYAHHEPVPAYPAPFAPSAPPHAYDVRPALPTHAPFAIDATPMPGTYGVPTRSVGKIVGVVAACTAGLALLGGAAFFGVSRLAHGSSPHLASVVPDNATFFVEAPSLKRALVDLATTKVIDKSATGSDGVSNATQGMADAFGIPLADAAKLVLSADAVAFAGRDLDKKDSSAELIVAFGSGGPVEALLSSSRFTREGAIGKSGHFYKLAAGSAPAAGAGTVATALASLSTDNRKLVYFEDRHLLVKGDDSILRDTAAILDGTASSLEKRDAYQKGIKQLDASSDVVAFVDESAIRNGASGADAKTKALLNGYLRDPGTIEAEVKIAPAGILFNTHATLSGDSMPAKDAVPAPVHLAFPRRLPAETIAYLASTTKNDLKGADAKARLIKALQGTDPSAAALATSSIDSFERESGFTVAELLDMVGDESALAVLADKDFAYGPKKPIADAALAGAGVLIAMQVDDDAIARKVVGKLRDKAKDLGSMATLTPDADGFRLDPAAGSGGALGLGQLPSLQLKLTKKALLLAVAQKPLLARAIASFEDGKGTLDGDGGHDLAMKALRSDAHGYLWVDLGRIVSLAYAANPADRESAKALGIPADAVKLVGDERVTAAMDYRLHQEGGAWILDVESLNLPGFSLLAGEGGPGLGAVAKAVTGGGSSSNAKAAPASLGGSLDGTDDVQSIGVASCDAYLTRLSSCGAGQPGAVGESYRQAADRTRAQWLKLPQRSRNKLAKSCASLLAGLDKNALCK